MSIAGNRAPFSVCWRCHYVNVTQRGRIAEGVNAIPRASCDSGGCRRTERYPQTYFRCRGDYRPRQQPLLRLERIHTRRLYPSADQNTAPCRGENLGLSYSFRGNTHTTNALWGTFTLKEVLPQTSYKLGGQFRVAVVGLVVITKTRERRRSQRVAQQGEAEQEGELSRDLVISRRPLRRWHNRMKHQRTRRVHPIEMRECTVF